MLNRRCTRFAAKSWRRAEKRFPSIAKEVSDKRAGYTFAYSMSGVMSAGGTAESSLSEGAVAQSAARFEEAVQASPQRQASTDTILHHQRLSVSAAAR